MSGEVLQEARASLIADILRTLVPTPASYASAAAQIEAEPPEGLQPIKLAVLSTYTADLLRPYLVVEGAARGFLFHPHFAPFGQLEQQILDETSALYAFGPDVVVIATQLDELAPRLTTSFLSLSSSDIEAELEGMTARLQRLLRGIRRMTPARIFVCNFADPLRLAAGIGDPALEPSQTAVWQRANERVARICRSCAGAYVFDYARLARSVGVHRWYDQRLQFLGRIPFGAEAQRSLGRALARLVRATYRIPCKCLVLDLDNTLWGGVLGEEGIGGIALGDDYPGNVYKDFQRYLLMLRDRGVLLAVASKNDERDVREVFDRHPHCVVKMEHFAALQIHWEEKASSLTAIAQGLRIGMDSIAFFDDNPVEREWIRTRLPDVTILETPASPLGFIEAIEDSGVFDQAVVSSEDRARSTLYQREHARERLQRESVSLEAFLRELKMVASVGMVTEQTLPRVSQLLAKTNQWNLTTRRHTAADVQAMVHSGGLALWLRLKDRFGDHGLVGVAIAVPEASREWRIDTFLLSCRVIGRQAETALLAVLSQLIQERGGTLLKGEFIPTAKNGPAARCYADLGFEPADSSGRCWRWDLAVRGHISTPDVMVVHEDDVPGA